MIYSPSGGMWNVGASVGSAVETVKVKVTTARRGAGVLKVMVMAREGGREGGNGMAWRAAMGSPRSLLTLRSPPTDRHNHNHHHPHHHKGEARGALTLNPFTNSLIFSRRFPKIALRFPYDHSYRIRDTGIECEHAHERECRECPSCEL